MESNIGILPLICETTQKGMSECIEKLYDESEIEKKQRQGCRCYIYDYNGEGSGLVACFDGAISEDTIQEITRMKPLTAVFRESSFASSAEKVNLAEHFRMLSPETKIKVI